MYNKCSVTGQGLCALVEISKCLYPVCMLKILKGVAHGIERHIATGLVNKW